MKLSSYAKQLGVSYSTVYRLFNEGKLNAFQLPTGTIIVRDDNRSCGIPSITKQVAIYCRVSSSENKDNLEKQSERLQQYAVAKGYTIYKLTKEIASGLNDNRPQLEKLLLDKNYNILLVEHKDRLTRFGFNYLEILFKEQNRIIEVINYEEDKKDDLIQDFISIINSFCARIYGLRRSKRKTEKIIKELEDSKEPDLETEDATNI